MVRPRFHAGGRLGVAARTGTSRDPIAAKICCTTETLRKWVRQSERDQGIRAGLSSEERERLKALEQENRELKRANEILRRVAAYFAQAELDRRRR